MTAPTASPPALMTADEAAVYLVLPPCRLAEVPEPISIGGRLVYRRAALDAWREAAR